MATGKDRQQHDSHYHIRESDLQHSLFMVDNPVPIGLVQNESMK